MLIDHPNYRINTSFERLLKQIRWTLPEGRLLPDDVWQSRHWGIRALLWLHVIGVVCFGLIVGARLEHSLAEGVVLAALAVAASWHNTPRRFRSSMASLGLITASAVLVHLSGGYIEVHFHFFVMLAVIVLYQDWVPFLLALGYVVIHHGVIGVLDPGSVYNHPDAFAHPWKWAAIHGGFVLAASVASIISWRLNEALRAHNELILNSTGDGIIGLDRQGTITFMNPAAARMVGYKGEELKGRPLHSLLRPSKAAGASHPENEYWNLAPIQEGAVQSVIESVFWCKDGRSFLAEHVSTPIRAGDVVVGAVVTFRDITERKQAQSALQKAKDELEIRVVERTAELNETNERLHFELTERKQAEEALRQSEQRFRQVVSSISDHIYVTEVTKDGEYINLYLSPHVEPLTGYPLEKFIADWSFWPSTVIHPDDRATAAVQAGQLATGQSSQIEYRLIQANGDIIWVRDSGRVEKDTDRQSLIVYGLVSDITERKQVEEALALARDQALAASRLKTELLAKVSHELRTPLGVILGFAEMLDVDGYGPLSDKKRHMTAKIINSTQYLTRLVNELLDQAQLEAGRLKLNIHPFTPADLIDDTLAKMSVLAGAKGLSLTGDIAADVPAILRGDAARLQQILVNLINNAIKFTPAGAVRVRLYCPDADHWALQVFDTGSGIPREAQTYIFEPFRQVDGSMTRSQAGTGLGLSIVKQLTTLMGGDITLESNVGQGSTFTISLPLQPILEKIV